MYPTLCCWNWHSLITQSLSSTHYGQQSKIHQLTLAIFPLKMWPVVCFSVPANLCRSPSGCPLFLSSLVPLINAFWFMTHYKFAQNPHGSIQKPKFLSKCLYSEWGFLPASFKEGFVVIQKRGLGFLCVSLIWLGFCKPLNWSPLCWFDIAWCLDDF